MTSEEREQRDELAEAFNTLSRDEVAKMFNALSCEERSELVALTHKFKQESVSVTDFGRGLQLLKKAGFVSPDRSLSVY